MSWRIENTWIDPESVPDNGNRLLVGNGYLGIRGTLEEAGKAQLAAVNLAGIYDRVGDGWREPLNAPNPLYTRVCVGGELLTALDGSADRHTQALDFRHGIYSRDTNWRRVGLTVHGTHAAHMGQEHLILSAYTVTAEQDTQLDIIAGIDTDIWEIYGPHYLRFEEKIADTTLLCTGIVQNGKNSVSVGRRCCLDRPAEVRQEENRLIFRLRLKAGQQAELRSVSAEIGRAHV